MKTKSIAYNIKIDFNRKTALICSSRSQKQVMSQIPIEKKNNFLSSGEVLRISLLRTNKRERFMRRSAVPKCFSFQAICKFYLKWLEVMNKLLKKHNLYIELKLFLNIIITEEN